MNKFINRIFILVLLCNIGALKIHAQVKTIVLDWKTKTFNDVFPFDEKFQIKIINLTSDLKSPLHLRILKLDDKKIPESLTNNGGVYDNVALDETYYSKLKGQELTFYFNDIDTASATSVEFASLKPNQAYVVYGFGSKRKTLTDDEKSDIKKSLDNNATFKNAIYNKILHESYFTLKPEVLNDLMLSAVHEINDNYDIDLKTVDEKIKSDVKNIGVAIINVKSGIKNLKDNLKNILADKTAGSRALFDKIDALGDAYVSGKMERHALVSSLMDLKPRFKQAVDSSAYQNIDDEFEFRRDYFDAQNTNVDNLIDHLKDDALPGIIAEETVRIIVLNNTIPGSIQAKANIYISQSAGAGYSVRTDKILSYISYSFFFRPVNQEISLDNYTGWDLLKVRLCLNVGFTLNDITTNKNGQISGTLGNQAIIVGGGFRILPFLKVDVNNAFYYLNDPNPLIKHKHLNTSTIFGLSLNLNIARLFAGQANPLNNPSALFK